MRNYDIYLKLMTKPIIVNGKKVNRTFKESLVKLFIIQEKKFVKDLELVWNQPMKCFERKIGIKKIQFYGFKPNEKAWIADLWVLNRKKRIQHFMITDLRIDIQKFIDAVLTI